MKRIILLSSICWFCLLNAQNNRMIDLKFEITSPKDSQYYKLPNLVKVSIKATNLGPDTLYAGDSILFGVYLAMNMHKKTFTLDSHVVPNEFIELKDTITYFDKPSPPFVQNYGTNPLMLNFCFAKSNKKASIRQIDNNYELYQNRYLNNRDTVILTYTNAASQIVKNQISPLKIFPNPAQSFIWLKSESIIDEIRVTNLYGKDIFNKNVNSRVFKLNTDGWKSGTYLIVVKNKDSSTYNRTIIKL